MEELEDKETLEEIKETQERVKQTFETKINKKKLSKRELDDLFA